MPARKTFEAPLVSGGQGGSWPLLTIPFNVEEEFGSKARVSVKGTINGFPYQTTIFPNGDGTHILMVNRQIREAAKASVGDIVHVMMEVDSGSRRVSLPPDFKKALTQNKKAKESFEKLSPSHRRAYIEAILEAKKPETRVRRIEEAVKMLLFGKKT